MKDQRKHTPKVVAKRKYKKPKLTLKVPMETRTGSNCPS